MKGTEQFKLTIKQHLDKLAEEDLEFSFKYTNPKKSLEECINFILQEVQKSGCNGFADEEIYGIAIHYYDEENMGKVKEIKANVVVNHQVELTAEEKEKIRKDAIEELKKETIEKMRKTTVKPTKVKTKEVQLSLL